jgi:hypothetical protein
VQCEKSAGIVFFAGCVLLYAFPYLDMCCLLFERRVQIVLRCSDSVTNSCFEKGYEIDTFLKVSCSLVFN